MAGHADEINVTVHADDSVTVVDNGRGIPVDMHATGKTSGCGSGAHCFARWRKIRQRNLQSFPAAYTASASRWSMRSSDWLELEISRDGGVWEQTYEKRQAHLKAQADRQDPQDRNEVTFHPDRQSSIRRPTASIRWRSDCASWPSSTKV